MGPDRQAITGLLLAGGEGRRMGGRDKGLLPLHGEPLAAHVLRRLAPQVGALLVSANRNAEHYLGLAQALDPSARVLSDDPAAAGGERYAGPLAGLLAGLRACRSEWLLYVPCDLPALPADLAARLMAGRLAAGHAPPVALPRDSQGRLHPSCGLLHRSLADSLASYLGAGGRRVRDWLQAQGAREIAFEQAGDLQAFTNLNQPEDLIALEQLPPLNAHVQAPPR